MLSQKVAKSTSIMTNFKSCERVSHVRRLKRSQLRVIKHKRKRVITIRNTAFPRAVSTFSVPIA